jgi:hypothetical protein
MILYHGSKSGIKGSIQPISRAECDFGRGFYMGDKEDQPKSLVSEFKDNMFYELDCDFSGLKVLDFTDDYESQLDWSLFIAYNRKQFDTEKYTKLSKKYEAYNNDYDVIAGLIADDKMTEALQRFFDGTFSDKALIAAMSRVKLGRQFVAKTEIACSNEHIKIVSSRKLSDNELLTAKSFNEQRRRQNTTVLNEITTRFRRSTDVKFFDEILEEYGL